MGELTTSKHFWKFKFNCFWRDLLLQRFAFPKYYTIDTELAFFKALQATLNSMDSKNVFGIYYVSQKNASIWHFCCWRKSLSSRKNVWRWSPSLPPLLVVFVVVVVLYVCVRRNIKSQPKILLWRSMSGQTKYLEEIDKSKIWSIEWTLANNNRLFVVPFDY